MPSIPKNESGLGLSLGPVGVATIDSFRKGKALGETAGCGPFPVSSLPAGEVYDFIASCRVLS